MNEKKGKQTAKISISQKAEAALDQMVRSANDGFLGGRITKHQLASWVIEYFSENAFDSQREALRASHFDKATYLEAMAKQIKLAAKRGESITEYEADVARVLTGHGSKVRRRNARSESVDT